MVLILTRWAVRRPPGSSSLDAAGITDPQTRADFLTCRALHASHGPTHFLATALLPPAKRPWVWALYGFGRCTDELVDSFTDADPAALIAWSSAFIEALRTGAAAEPVGRAMLATVRRWDIDPATVEVFLTSMRADIKVTHYSTYADLEQYIYGAASVIGLQMLPILQPLPGLEEEAAERAQALGTAFQIANIVRDVGEDLDRGRTYLPDESMAAAGVTRADLIECRRTGVVTPKVRALLAAEVARSRTLHAAAELGIAMLHPTSRDAVTCVHRLYTGLLDEIERADYQVMNQRVTVPRRRKFAIAGPALVRAHWARRRSHRSAHPLKAWARLQRLQAGPLVP